MDTSSKPSPAISILLVEDDKATLELLTTILTKKFPGVSLHTAMNGRFGLEKFKEQIQEIVITDINLPELNGIQMVKNIREIKPDAKIIVLTADTEKVALEHVVGEGFEFDYYIAKPVCFELLFSAIERCVDEVSK